MLPVDLVYDSEYHITYMGSYCRRYLSFKVGPDILTVVNKNQSSKSNPNQYLLLN